MVHEQSYFEISGSICNRDEKVKIFSRETKAARRIHLFAAAFPNRIDAATGKYKLFYKLTLFSRWPASDT